MVDTVFILDGLSELSRAPSAGEEAGKGEAISYRCVVKHLLGEGKREKPWDAFRQLSLAGVTSRHRCDPSKMERAAFLC